MWRGGGAFAEGYWKGSLSAAQGYIGGNVTHPFTIPTPSDAGRISATKDGFTFPDAGKYLVTFNIASNGTSVSGSATFQIVANTENGVVDLIEPFKNSFSWLYTKTGKGEITVNAGETVEIDLKANGTWGANISQLTLENLSIIRIE